VYRKEKKRVEKELLSTFKDESIIVMADWLKVFLSYLYVPAKDLPPFRRQRPERWLFEREITQNFIVWLWVRSTGG
jgi:hypothetical protein